jgi:hypothetical protein
VILLLLNKAGNSSLKSTMNNFATNLAKYRMWQNIEAQSLSAEHPRLGLLAPRTGKKNGKRAQQGHPGQGASSPRQFF